MLVLSFSIVLAAGLSACASDSADVHSEAQEMHEGQTAMHGGMVLSAGSGHMEMVLDDGRFFIYPFDGDQRPHSMEGIGDATATIESVDGEKHVVPLTMMGDHLMGTLPSGTHEFTTAHVTMPMASETWSASFHMGRESL